MLREKNITIRHSCIYSFTKKSLRTALKLFLISIPLNILKTFQDISEFIYEVAHFLELFISQRSVKHLPSIPPHASIYYNKNPIYLPGNVFVEDEFMKSRGIKAVLDSNADSSVFIMLLLSLYQLNPNSDQQIMALCNQLPPNTEKVGLVCPISMSSRVEGPVHPCLWEVENRGLQIIKNSSTT